MLTCGGIALTSMGLCIECTARLPHISTETRKRSHIRMRKGYLIYLLLSGAAVFAQPSDLQGGHAENKYLLPDPFYRVP